MKIRTITNRCRHCNCWASYESTSTLCRRLAPVHARNFATTASALRSTLTLRPEVWPGYHFHAISYTRSTSAPKYSRRVCGPLCNTEYVGSTCAADGNNTTSVQSHSRQLGSPSKSARQDHTPLREYSCLNELPALTRPVPEAQPCLRPSSDISKRGNHLTPAWNITSGKPDLLSRWYLAPSSRHNATFYRTSFGPYLSSPVLIFV